MMSLRAAIVNWAEVVRHLLSRAERELGASPDDPTATALLDELHGYGGPHPRPPQAPFGAADRDPL